MCGSIVPVIDGSSGTDSIWMYYGNAVAADAQNATEVWTGSYEAIYHLEDDAATPGVLADSGTNGFDGTIMGTARSGGMIGIGQQFDGGGEYVDLGADQAFLNNVSAATLSVWVNPDVVTGNGDILGVSGNDSVPTGDSRAAIVRTGDNITVYAATQDDFSDAVTVTATTNPLAAGTWYHVTAVIDYANDSVRIYIDGVEQATSGVVSFTGTATDNTNSTSGAIGSDEDGTDDFFEGVIDEARISSVLRSDDWIAAQQLSMTDASFVSFGVQEVDAGVMCNDIDPDGDALTAILVTGPSNALSFTLNADGTFTYTATANYNGADSFTYKLNDGSLDSNTATVSITVNAMNDAPVVTAPGSALSATEQVNLSIERTGFTVSDVDEAGSGATATLNVGEGAITVVIGDSGVTIDSGNGTGTVTVSGTITQINTLLNDTSTGTITYLNSSDTPSASTTFTVVVNDSGNTGADPGLTGNGSSEEGTNNVTINLTATNDDPTNAGSLPTDITVTEDVSGNVDLSAINLADLDAGGASLTVTLTTSTGGDITAAAGTGITVGGTSTARTLTGSLTNLNNYLNTAAT